MSDSPQEIYTHHEVVEKIITGSQEHVYDQWLITVWKQGCDIGSVKIIEQGAPDTCIGSTRVVTFGVTEMILPATLKGQTVVYSVVAGPFPVKNHKGVVTFQQFQDQNKTKVTWEVHYTPFPWSNLLVKASILIFFPIFLNKLHKVMEDQYQNQDKEKEKEK